MTDPADTPAWIAPGSRARWLLILGVLSVVLSLWLAGLGEALRTAAAPAGIVSFELARTAAEAGAILDSWSPAARETAMLVQGIDFLYLLVYPAFLSLAAASCGGLLGGRWQRVGGSVSRAVLFAAPLDAIENLALIRQLSEGAGELPARIACYTAIPKFALVIAGAAFVVVALGTLALRRARR